MSAIDVGAPVFTSRTIGIIMNGTNFSTAMRGYYFDDEPNSDGEEDSDLQFVGASGIHGNVRVDLTAPTVDTAHLRQNFHMLNPLGYQNRLISQLLLDFVFEQLHVGKGVIRMSPVGDGVTSNWGAFGPKWGQIDEPMTAPDFTNSMATAGAGNQQDLLFPSLPTNALRVSEAIVSFFGLMTKGPAGSDEGMGFGFQLKHGSLGGLSRKMIADMYADGKIQARRVKLERIDQLPGVFNAGFLAVTAERGAAGGAPNPQWRIHTLEMLVYYENTLPSYDVIDLASFSSHDSYFTTYPRETALQGSAWTLDFDLIDTTGYSALLDILAHCPELFCYVDYTGKLKLARIDAYANTATPRALSTEDGSITAVKRGPYRVDERYANAIELRWGVNVSQVSNGIADPVNEPAERGTRKIIRGANGLPVAGWEDRKILDRHFIRSSKVAEACETMYRHLWAEENGREVSGIDLVCPYKCIDVEPGDVVAVTVPNLGLIGKNYRCVEKTLDLERDELNITVYDVENTL